MKKVKFCSAGDFSLEKVRLGGSSGESHSYILLKEFLFCFSFLCCNVVVHIFNSKNKIRLYFVQSNQGFCLAHLTSHLLESSS